MALGVITFMLEFSAGRGETTADYQVRGLQESKQSNLINVVKSQSQSLRYIFTNGDKDSTNQILIKFICLHPFVPSTGASEITLLQQASLGIAPW